MRNLFGTKRGSALVWQITFGDLLTLLVCFFLVLTQTIVTEADVSPYSQVVSNSGGQRMFTGIELASPKKNQSLRIVSVLDISPARLRNGSVSGAVKEQVADFGERELGVALHAQISVCQSLVDRATDTADIVESIYRAVSSARFGLQSIELRFDRPCKVGQWDEQYEIGDVRLVTMEVGDGRRV